MKNILTYVFRKQIRNINVGANIVRPQVTTKSKRETDGSLCVISGISWDVQHTGIFIRMIRDNL